MAYGYYRNITSGATGASTDLTNFPALFSFSNADFKTVANGGLIQHTVAGPVVTAPADMVFSPNINGSSPYSWEFVSYDPTTGAGLVWIKFPSLIHTSNSIYVTYGDASVTTFQGGAVGAAWNSNFKYVCHGGDGTTPSVVDSTSNALTATNHSATAAAGKVNGGLSFNGISAYVDLGNPSALNFTGAFTTIVWMNATVLPTDGSNELVYVLGHGWSGTASQYDFLFRSDPGFDPIANLYAGYYDGADHSTHYNITGNVNTGTYYRLAIQYDGTNWKIFRNGVQVASTAGAAPVSNSINVSYGARINSGSPDLFINAVLNEIYFVGAALTADWLLVDYTISNSPGTFWTLGSQQIPATTVNLTGVQGTGSVGTFTVNINGNNSINLTGLQGVGSVGTFGITKSQNPTLVGVQGAGSVGAFTPTNVDATLLAIAPYLSTDTIGSKTYQLYKIVAGVLTAIGSPTSTGFTAIPNITNGWWVSIPVAFNGAFQDFAGIAVFGNINGSDARAIELYSPPRIVPTSLVIDKVAPFQPSDVIVTPGYQLSDKLGAPVGSHVTAGILAIPGVTNGYVTKLTLTPDANNGIQNGILWDGG